MKNRHKNIGNHNLSTGFYEVATWGCELIGKFSNPTYGTARPGKVLKSNLPHQKDLSKITINLFFCYILNVLLFVFISSTISKIVFMSL